VSNPAPGAAVSGVVLISTGARLPAGNAPTAPAPGAKVSVEGTALSVVAGSNGRFVLRDVPPGARRITITLSGYDSAHTPQITLRGGKALEVLATLHDTSAPRPPRPLTLEEIRAIDPIGMYASDDECKQAQMIVIDGTIMLECPVGLPPDVLLLDIARVELLPGSVAVLLYGRRAHKGTIGITTRDGNGRRRMRTPR
jgi:hypothetical protein